MASRRSAFVLNFDVEYELENPRGYRTATGVQRHMERLNEVFARGLGDDDVIITAATPAGSLNDFQGIAWCPTPRALRLLVQSGAHPPCAPGLSILQRVNDRRFAAGLAPDPLQPCYVSTLEAALLALRPPFPVHGYLAKRAFGFSGRGHRVFLGPNTLTADELGWLRNSLRRGPGILIEPRVPRLLDCAIHGMLEADGQLQLGSPLVQHCDVRGVWQRTEPPPGASGPAAQRESNSPSALTAVERAALQASAKRTASALHAEGYYGPFGIDAFRYVDSTGATGFRPLVELNARLTMGYVHSGLPFCPRAF